MSPSALVCVACGWQAAADATYPFTCIHRGEGDGDHLLEHRLAGDATLDRHDSANPFVRWREALYAWHAARVRGWRDSRFVSLVERLDDAIARIDGHGFAITPFGTVPALNDRVGWISPGAVNHLALRLDLAPAEIYGVASFYALFATTERPARQVHVCVDLACRMAGVTEADVPAGAHPSPCLGLCERAPAALIVDPAFMPMIAELRPPPLAPMA